MGWMLVRTGNDALLSCEHHPNASTDRTVTVEKTASFKLLYRNADWWICCNAGKLIDDASPAYRNAFEPTIEQIGKSTVFKLLQY